MSTIPEEVLYPFPAYPEAGKSLELAPGIRWINSPLPFRLRSINLYMLEDPDGWTLIDCGYSRDDVRTQWEQIWGSTLNGKPVNRLIVTHFHPDHAGNMAWISERWDLRPKMTQAEWLIANLAAQNLNAANIAHRRAFYIANGLSTEHQAILHTGVIPYSRGVRLPMNYDRLFDGDELSIGGRTWRIITAQGHSPEHASLYCERDGLLIAGDQLLPEITTNVSVWPDEPDADSLGLFLQSLDRYDAMLRPGTIVLPAHRRPFTGVHTRIRQLRLHHRERLACLMEKASQGPVSAGSLLTHLFPPGLNGHQIGFAMGEALAHLNYLVNRGLLRRYTDQGITCFATT